MVLVRPRYAGNVGAACRAAANFGAGEVAIVAPTYMPDEFELERMAMGALTHLPLSEYDELREAVEGRHLVIGTTSGRARGKRTLLAPRAVRDLIEARSPRRVAVVFGNEQNGLTAAELRRCHVLCSVPTAPEFGVLNLGQAVAVVLAYLTEGVMPPPPPLAEADLPAPAAEFAAALEQLREVLLRTGFLDPAKPERIMDRLRRWLGRTVPSRREVAILRALAAHHDYVHSSAGRD